MATIIETTDLFPDRNQVPKISTPRLAQGLPLDEADAQDKKEFLRPVEELDQRIAHRKHQDWVRENSKRIQGALLDFDNFEPQEEEDVRRHALVSAFMDVEHGIKPEDSMGHDVARDQLADQLFEGRGAGDDDAFFKEIQGLAQTRKDRSDLGESLIREAALDLLSGGKNPFSQWDESNRGHAGRDGSEDGRYLQAWKETQQRLEERYGDVLPIVNAMYGWVEAGNPNAVGEFYYDLSDEERPLALSLLKMAAQGLSEEKKATFLGNLKKQAGRDVDGLLTSIGDGIKAYTINATVGFSSSPSLIAQGRMERGESGFRRDVRRIFEEDFDPVRHLYPEGTFIGSSERAAYATPGVLASTAVAITPYVGQMAIFAAMEEDSYQEYRRRFMEAGLSEEQAMAEASHLSTFVGAGQAALERVGGRAVLGKFPVLDEVLTKFGDKITNRALRFGTKAGISAAQETAIENIQDLTLELTQDVTSALKEDIPDVDWNQVFDGYAHKTLTTFLAVLPLSVFGAAGGISTERRNEAFKKATKLERLAAGMLEQDSDAIDAAKGPESLSQAVANASKNMEPNSESAIDATHELAEKIQHQRELEMDAQRAGALPRVKVGPDGIQIINPEDGKVIGIAQDSDQAISMIDDHTQLMERAGQNRIDYLKTMIEGAEFTRKQDGDARSTTVELRLDEVTTVAQAAAESSVQAERAAEQLRIREKMNGGDGSITDLVLGSSQTEFEGRQRNTINRLNGGSSIFTVFHEDAHGLYREALNTGRLTRGETIDFFKKIDIGLEGKTTRSGREIRFLPVEGEITDTILDEAVSEFAEVEILRTRKGEKQGIGSVINRNLSAIARTVPGANKFKAFIDAMRKFFEIALTRHLHIKKSLSDGTLDEAMLDEFRANLQGTNAQEEFDGEVKKEFEATLEEKSGEISEMDVPFSIAREKLDVGGISYAIEDDENLVAIHNLSESNLIFSDQEFGAIPPPSIAIVRTDISDFDGFGEITLISPPDRIDPRLSRHHKVWNADAYTPRFPSFQYKVDHRESSRIREEYAELSQSLGFSEWDLIPADFEDKGLDSLRQNVIFQYAFLKENGRSPKPKLQAKIHLPAKLVKLARGKMEPDVAKDEDFKEEAKDYFNKEVTVLTEATGKEDRTFWQERYFDEDGDVQRGRLMDLIRNAHKADKPREIDKRATRELIGNRIKSKRKEFDNWIDQKFSNLEEKKRIPNGFTASGNRRYLDFNLDNVVRLMTKNVKGGEGFNYGVGSIRAVAAKEFRSLNQIKKDRSKIVTNSEMKEFKESSENAFHELADELRSYYKYDSGNFRYLDQVSEGMMDLARGRFSDWRHMFEDVDSDLQSRVYQFLESLKNAPTEYFEVKITDSVPVSDFKVAIVPKSASKEVKDLLRTKGVKVRIYDPNEEGGRKNVIESEAKRAKASFSLGNSEIADALVADVTKRVKRPETRARIMGYIARRIESLKREIDQIIRVAGRDVTQKAIVDPRTLSSLRKESSAKRLEIEDELALAVWQRFGNILSDDSLTKLKEQPVHAELSRPNDPLHGVLASKSQAVSHGYDPDLHGDYDGSEGVSQSVFGGSKMPDQAAQELYESGHISDPYTDTMWNALRAEQDSVLQAKGNYRDAINALKEAKVQARAEAKQWLEERVAEQERDHSPMARVRRALATLDAILMALPPELRGKVGGYTQLAKIGSDEKRLDFLLKRIEKVDVVVEKWLRKEYGGMMKKLLKRAEPKQGEAGKGKRGQAGADVHRLFDELTTVMALKPEQVEAEMSKIDKILNSGEPLSDPDQNHYEQMANLIPLFGDWAKADAARMESAVRNGLHVYEGGYLDQLVKTTKKREEREAARSTLARETGKKGTARERDDKSIVDNSLKALPEKSMLSLLSFEQVLKWGFGRNSKLAQKFSDQEREASSQKQDTLDIEFDAFSDVFTQLADGNVVEGEKLRWKMAQKSIETKAVERGLSEAEAIQATLMWRQEDGRRHMQGRKKETDEHGNVIREATAWAYTQEFIDEIEAKLSNEAKAVRDYLIEQYSGEYDSINAVHEELYGISLPRHKNYSPLTVAPTQVSDSGMIDPVSGMETSGISITPGALRTRSRIAVAEPQFRDAFQVFIGHKKQMEHWKAYAPIVTEMRAIFNNRDLGNNIEAATGKEGLTVIRKWIDVFAMGGVRDMSMQLSLNQTMSRMTGRAASAALIGRFSVLAIQATQIGASLAKMPAKSYIKRMGKLMTGQLGWKTAIASDYIQRRKKAAPPIVRQALDSLAAAEPSKVKHLVSRMGELISGADALFTAGTYAIIYDYQLTLARNEGLGQKAAEKRAREEAERLTEDVAQPVRMGSRSLFENSTQNNPGMRLLWAFSSEPRQKLALAAFELAKGTPSQKARALAVTWGFGGAVASIIRAIMADIRSDDDDWFDDRHWNAKRLALQSLVGPLQGVPVLGDTLEAAVFKGAGEYLPEGNLFSGIERSVVAGKSVISGDSFDDDDKLLRDIDAIISGAALLNDSAAAWSSISHLGKDMYSIGKNALK